MNLENGSFFSKFWMMAVIIFLQAIWNPILFTITTIQVYAASFFLFAFFILRPIFFRGKRQIPNTLDPFPAWVFFCYCMSFLLSTLVSGINEYAIQNFTRLTSLFVLIIFVQYFEMGLIRFINIYFVLNCVLGLILISNLLHSGINISNRISPAGQGSANSFGATLAIVCLLRLSLHEMFPSIQNRIVFFLGLPIIFLTILGTYSRGATVGFVLGMLLFGMQNIRISHVPKILGFLSLLLILVELFGITELPLFSRYSANSFHDSSGRNVIFQNAIDAFSRNPIFGSGVGSKLNPYSSGEASVHNVFFQVMGETGLIGVLLLVFFLGLLIARYHPKQVVPSLGCLFLVSLTDNHFLAVQFHLTIGLIYLTLLSDKRKYFA